MKVVLDVNVLVSAAIQRLGKSRKILAMAGIDFEWMTCNYILRKVVNVLSCRHIQKKYGVWLTPQNQKKYIQAIRQIARIVKVHSHINVIGDQDDDIVLACAKDSQSDYLVSGDPHLKDLKEFADFKIVSPDEFLKILMT